MTHYDNNYDGLSEDILCTQSPVAELFFTCEHAHEGECLACSINGHLADKASDDE